MPRCKTPGCSTPRLNSVIWMLLAQPGTEAIHLESMHHFNNNNQFELYE